MKKRKGNIKRRVSALLMSVLCLTMIVPSGVSVFAEEVPDEGGDSSYAVTLNQSEGGTLAFTDAEGDTVRFAEGDAVSIELEPDDGFEFSSITLAYSDTGEIAAEGADQGVTSYSFMMPAADLTVSAEWAEAEIIEEAVPKEAGEEVPGAVNHFIKSCLLYSIRI